MELFSDKFWMFFLSILFLKYYIIDSRKKQWDLFLWGEFILAGLMTIVLVGNLSGILRLVAPIPYLILVMCIFASIRDFFEEDRKDYSSYEVAKYIFIKLFYLILLAILLFGNW